MVIHARSDAVFAGLLARLALPPKPFELTRHLRLRAAPAELRELKPAAAKAAARAICGNVRAAAGASGKASAAGAGAGWWRCSGSRRRAQQLWRWKWRAPTATA